MLFNPIRILLFKYKADKLLQHDEPRGSSQSTACRTDTQDIVGESEKVQVAQRLPATSVMVILILLLIS